MRDLAKGQHHDVSRRGNRKDTRQDKVLAQIDFQSGLRIELLQWAYQDFVRSRKVDAWTRFAFRWKSLILGIQTPKPSTTLQKQFFDSFFDLLAGSPDLRIALIKGYSTAKIRASWQPELNNFRRLRSPYLLYPEL